MFWCKSADKLLFPRPEKKTFHGSIKRSQEVIIYNTGITSRWFELGEVGFDDLPI